MGVQASRRYFVSAERFTAQQAFAMGMVHEVCTAEKLDAVVAQHVSQLMSNGPQAVRLCKQLVRDVAHQPNTQTLRDETAKRIADIRASAEGKDGLQSFLNKRPPNWLV
jgi:methylglutaconyl-CoA hydratase